MGRNKAPLMEDKYSLKDPFQGLYIGDRFDKIIERVKLLIANDNLESYNEARIESEIKYADYDAEIRTKKVYYNLVKFFPQQDHQDIYYYRLTGFPKNSKIIEVKFYIELNKHKIELIKKLEYTLRSRQLVTILRELEDQYGKFEYSQSVKKGVEIIHWKRFITKINRPRLMISLKTKNLRLILGFENK